MAEYIAGVKGVNLSQIRRPTPMVQITVEGWSDTAKGQHMTSLTWEYLTIAEAVSIAKAVLNRYEPTALADHTNASRAERSGRWGDASGNRHGDTSEEV